MITSPKIIQAGEVTICVSGCGSERMDKILLCRKQESVDITYTDVIVDVMRTNKPNYLVDVPEALLPIVGPPDPDTRMYRTEGDAAQCAHWFNQLVEAYPDSLVSPGGVSMFAPVSRAAVHKAMKEGRLTAFLFHEIKARRSLFGTVRAHRKNPFIYIPVIESQGWGRQLEAERVDYHELEGEKPDWNGGDIVSGPKEFRRRKPKLSGHRRSQKRKK